MPEENEISKLFELAKIDPEAAEELRLKIIEDNIVKMAKGDKEKEQVLRRYQFRVDAELRGYKDPVARMNKMVEMLWIGFGEFKNTMENLKNLGKVPVVETKEIPDNVVKIGKKDNE